MMLMSVVRGQDIPLSPCMFGLEEAASDTERYDVLYRTHLAAVEAGVDVDYDGVEPLTIEIPHNAKRIPLTRHTDFQGLVLTVKNLTKLDYLFEYTQSFDSIEVDKEMIDKGNFSSIPQLANGLHLLVIKDDKPWVANRTGYSYGATRRDILLVNNGKAVNSTISPYNNNASKPSCVFCAVGEDTLLIKNLTLKRHPESTNRLKCFYIAYQNNVHIQNINIQTPKNKLYGDAAITVENCTNLLCEDVIIKGTYSQPDHYGYGISLNNVWNSRFLHLKGSADWGIFGNNNVNTALLDECDVNRFDIHCYGRDITMSHCKFTKLYNQFSSVFGTVSFNNCRFSNFVPVLFEPSYNAYTGFDLVFKDCVFDVSSAHNYLVQAGRLDDSPNSREELSAKCLPNVTIQNMTVNVPENVSKVMIFNPKSANTKVSMGHIEKIKINGMRFNYSGSGHSACLYLSSQELQLKKSLNCDIKQLDLLPMSDSKIAQAQKKYYYPSSLYINMSRHKASDVIRISDSRMNYNVNANEHYSISFTHCTLGLVRNTSVANGSKRQYKDCNLYMNCSDEKYYYIDNHATYENCLFIPCNQIMQVDFVGEQNDVTIKNCKVKNRPYFMRGGSKNNAEFNRFSLKGARK